MNLKEFPEKVSLCETDRLLLVQLNNLIKVSTDSFDKYNFLNVKLETAKFFWETLADNYLEIVKRRVYQGNKKEKESAFFTLYNSFLTIIKLLAPIMPFITEEIYQKYFKNKEKVKSIHLSNWPKKIKIKTKSNDDEKWKKLVEIISKVRQAKTNAKKSMKTPVILTIPEEDYVLLEDCLEDLKGVTCAEKIEKGDFNVELI